MPIEAVTAYNQTLHRMSNFQNGNSKVAYGHINMPQKNPESTVTKWDKFKALSGSVAGVSIPVMYLMKKQNTKNGSNICHIYWDYHGSSICRYSSI